MSSQYATSTNFTALGLPAAALDGFTGDVNDHLRAASGKIDTFLRGRYKLPLASPPQELIDACCVIAAYSVLAIRGYDPSAGYDRVVRERYDDLLGRPGQEGWLMMLASGKVNLDIAADATPGVNDGRPIVTSAGGSAASSTFRCADDWGARGGRFNFWGNNRC